ncbi:MAG: MmgE/PrpD family protein [Alphaproteobacteria bacterium]|nr:MmgE/PrpD family protein [Alphaproteobacteria bacterium]
MARRLAGFALGLDLAAIPDAVVESAKLHLLDSLGVGLAASSLPGNAGWGDAVAGLGEGGASTALGRGAPMPCASAALLNGSLIHSLEFDATHVASIVHGGAVIAPTALAVAEARGCSGAELLRAFIAGWEVFIRLGLASPGRFQAEGFQITAVGGAFVAALMTAMLERRDVATTVNAVGIAGSQASGVFEFLAEGASVKGLHPGWAAHAGIVAAAMAAGGMTGPSTILDGRFGFYRTFARDPEAPARLAGLLDDLGRTWRLPETALKAYATCHYIHPFLEALGVLIERVGGADRIVSAHCHVPAEQAPLIAEPWPAKQSPRSGYDAKWSLPYCLAALLVDGKVALETFVGAPRPELVARAASMTWAPWRDSGFPARFAARLDVRLADGSTMSHAVDDVRGGPSRPFPRETILAKFRDNAGRRLAPRAVDDVVAGVEGLGSASSLRDVTTALRALA